MKHSIQHLALAAFIGFAAVSGGLGGVLAQDASPEIDLDAIRARAANQSGEAEALGSQARERARGITAEAAASAEQGRANGRRRAGEAHARDGGDQATFDFDLMVADAGQMAKADMGEAPHFIAFASLSMPPAALKAMIADVTRAGGAVVFRGLTQGSAKATTQALARVLEPGEAMQGVGIDPRLFRAFQIDTVPAYVVTASDFDLCDGFDCTNAVPPHDRMTGNVTAAHALETFATGHGPGARIAALHLARLERTMP